MALEMGLCLLGGAGVGLSYFAGLWWTVKRLPGVRHPGGWALASFLARTSVGVGLIYLMSGGRWQGVLSVLCGFFLARFFLVRRLRPAKPT